MQRVKVSSTLRLGNLLIKFESFTAMLALPITLYLPG